MMVRLTSDHAVVLPREAAEALGAPRMVEVSVEDGRVILTRADVRAGDAVRQKLEALELTDQDVADAIAWARREM